MAGGTKKTTVAHRVRDNTDVYIGRPSKWGNPYKVRDHGRQKAIALYREWLYETPEGRKIMADAKKELKGKILGCWCKPLPCHGDVLAEIVNANS